MSILIFPVWIHCLLKMHSMQDEHPTITSGQIRNSGINHLSVCVCVCVCVSMFMSCGHTDTEGADIYLHPFLTSALDEGEWSMSHPECFTDGKKSWYPLNRRKAGSLPIYTCTYTYTHTGTHHPCI